VDVSGGGGASVTINKETVYQEIWGFGASIVAPAQNFYRDLSEKNREEVFDLFYLNEGDNIGLTINRMQIFPNNNPAPGVYDWDADSYQSDFAKEAYKRYPTPITASPWTPPAWMKINESLSDQDSGLKPEHFGSLAQWFYDWTYHHKDTLGLNVKWISIQNEPNANVTWNGCHYSPAEMEQALWSTLELFRSKNSTVAVGGPECGNDRSAQEFLDAMSPEIVAAIDWIPHHGYQQIRQPQNDLDFRKYNTPTLMTELCGGTVAQTGGVNDDITDGLLWSSHIQRALSRGETGYLFWQLLRDAAGNQSLFQLKNNQDFYHPFKRAFVFANYSRFIRPGYIIIDSKTTDSNLLVTSAKHPVTGNTSVIIANRTDKDIDATISGLSGGTLGGRITNEQYNFAATKDISGANGTFSVKIPSMSIVSFAEK